MNLSLSFDQKFILLLGLLILAIGLGMLMGLNPISLSLGVVIGLVTAATFLYITGEF